MKRDKQFSFLALSLVWLICAASLLQASSSQAQGDQENRQDSGESETQIKSLQRSRFVLSKLFTFHQFKQLFHKHYHSLVEELRRKKLYLSRLMRTFLSKLGYKHNLTDTYLSVNHLSDLTPDEVNKRLMKDDKIIEKLSRIATRQQPELAFSHPELMPPSVAPSGGSAGNLNSISEEQQLDSAVEIDEELGQVQLFDPTELDAILQKLEEAKIEKPGENFEEPLDERLSPYALDERVAPSGQKSALSQFLKSVDAKFSSLFTAKTKPKTQLKESRLVETRTGPRKIVVQDTIHVDHRGCIKSAPRDQGNCASCYAFAAISLYEWALCKATKGKEMSFSEQYIVDCANGVVEDLDGCNGGIFTQMGLFVNDYGIELAENYPYKQREQQCPFKKNSPIKSRGFLRIQNDSFDEVPYTKFDKYLRKTPLLINMVLNGKFSEYGGGVDMGKGCKESHGVHSVIIVGSGTQDGQDYWLIRNSFGVDWGESGYYKLNKRTACLYPDVGYILKPRFSPNESDNINRNYDEKLVRAKVDEYNKRDSELDAKQSKKGQRKFKVEP